MKRYLMFAGYTYYPSGGWSDFKGSFDTLDEIREHLLALKTGIDLDYGYDYEWCHAVDTQDMSENETGYIHIK